MPVNFNVKVNFDLGAIEADILKAADEAIPTVANEVLADSNKYAPVRQKILVGKTVIDQEETPIVQPIPGEQRATVAWRVPYAAYMYKGKSKKGKDLTYSKDPNPYAGKEWFAKAKENKFPDWKKAFEKLLKGFLRK
ncbi:MAG: minor capsid protein [Bacteroides sp.]|nr:minor capsid protein [Eubacterium sp.]MCM1419629.1 minor capsid protein [Roseburia sp.]MCM1462967.1 minor capsid protein [Bacteroides sp.]